MHTERFTQSHNAFFGKPVSMLYNAYEMQRSMLAGASAMANFGAGMLSNPANPFSYFGGGPVLASALSGEGLDTLLGVIEERLARRRVVLDLVLDPTDGAGVSWLHRHSEVMAKAMREDGRLGMTVRADATNAERIRGKFIP